ncbi:FIST N-terminal domain-containing protein [Curvibacter sp. HBC61]|uniref:FIST N-terminal domain-containing protein n=1 Tax=Curvibacter cyanobacteriorum TaxID=3026422 RepID=A0ABT5MU83_9BURK|nr:FIST N-terminal domain-containing protein [Curvibacter sp. HBC61]MDD0837603.1 FIST N-terminal domain-containing protein [Curvibacter sp. HBC61]
MRVQQVKLSSSQDLAALDELLGLDPAMLLVFGAVPFFSDFDLHGALRSRFPKALLMGCSTAGEISPDGVSDGQCVVTAVKFDRTTLRLASTRADTMADSFSAGERLGRDLAAPELQGVLLYGPGVALNGSALVEGLTCALGPGVPITGGLAADAGAFTQTWVLGNDGVSDRAVVALGLYGEAVRLGHGSFGGWVPFGPARRVTRAEGNVLHELDGEPALTIYKRYLGDHAKDLPASGLLFPFSMHDEAQDGTGLIRTILAVDEASGSLTLAGEVAQGCFLKLMQASTDRLIDGAENAAEAARAMQGGHDATLAILVSCVGRKLVMGSQVDEEVASVGEVLGPRALLTGFYSNGEISPLAEAGNCELHNQTMTITTLYEAA